MKKKIIRGLSGLLALSAIAVIMSACHPVPDDFKPTSWSVSIKSPGENIYLGDTVRLQAELTGISDSSAVSFSWQISGTEVHSGAGKTFIFRANKMGKYNVYLTATDPKTSAVKTAEIELSVLARGVVLSIGQKGGNYLSGDNLKFDSLDINFRITAPQGEILERFSLDFGDGAVLDTVVSEAQVIVSHRYLSYKGYTVTFVNSETIVRKFTIYEPGKIPDDDGDSGDGPDDTYDVNTDDYKALAEKTVYPDAMFAKVDRANKKLWLLLSVAATERSIGPENILNLKGNWEGVDYGSWETYLFAPAKELVVTTKKGKYILLEIDYEVNFKNRGNVLIDTNNWINAQNFAPYYGTDPEVWDTGSIHLQVGEDGKVYTY